MGLAGSRVASCCCRRNVLVTERGETVSLTAHEFDAVELESDAGGNFYISPELRAVTQSQPQPSRPRGPPSRSGRHWSRSGRRPDPNGHPPPPPLSDDE
ncbi:myristylated tegument protein [Macacine alphaherpesvirus 3]|uniref:Cytoplasmic envelopment protein 3 n=1 Tax=Macacine alphaherpesvirus 3 TaxID=2845555 RepID=A0A1X9WFA9_9ALPH|nr:myristylated tegument protein [Macacine alphaherpesvirus 1]ARS01722.1 myristylated tegument protein [Macacine alphaherpesvirus 1]ARS01797.1 myristylated tegument protein [Macacine alphaherpesvirus 3]